MKTFLVAAVLFIGAVACGGRRASLSSAAAAPAAEPRQYTYRVKAVYPHPADRYTQGLQYVGGTMWEGTGMRGESAIYSTDLETGATEKFAESPRSEFGEGITLLNGKLYQLTWTETRPMSTTCARATVCASSVTRTRAGGSPPTAASST